MRRKFWAFLLAAAVFCGSACAWEIRLPEGFSRLEGEAFYGVPGPDRIYIPPSCAYIGDDVFSSSDLTICGYAGSAAQSFAVRSGCEFVDVGIYGVGYAFDGCGYTHMPFSLSPVFESPCGAELTGFTVSPDGLVLGEDGLYTAQTPGAYDITVSCRNEYTEVTKTFPGALVFEDSLAINAPVEALSLGTGRFYIDPGQTLTLPLTVTPETDAVVIWESSDPSKLTVDRQGNITGVECGTARVTVTLAGCAGEDEEVISAYLDVNVLSDRRELRLPLRRTDADGIADNLARIERIRQSALTELRSAYARGEITAEVLSNRETVLSRAFSAYAFPWTTPADQPYWNEENSDDGTKNFVPGEIYYGLPYISGDYARNRAYTVSKALSEERYLPNGDHYLLNQDNLLSGTYTGCDCSAFVGGCYYPVTRIGEIRTQTLALSADFTTLPADAELIPGDILVSGYHHVVMFLYYADDAHSQIVLIEQGGDEYSINTVSVNVRPLSYYYGRGYIARRYGSWKYFR